MAKTRRKPRPGRRRRPEQRIYGMMKTYTKQAASQPLDILYAGPKR